MKILITGAAGFVGSNLCHRLTIMGLDYAAIDDLSFGDKRRLPNQCYFLESDFGKLSDELINTYDVLIHLACSNIIYAMNQPVQTFINNGIETVKLFSRFKGKIIYTSTASVYGNSQTFPTKESDLIQLSNGYDTSKYIAELFLQQRGNYTTLRLSNVYGRFQDSESPYCGVLGKFIDKYISGAPFTIYGTGAATRDYTYVEDVIDAVLLAIESEALNTEINIATGVETSTMFITQAIDINHEVIFGTERKIDTIKRRCLCISKAESLLNWMPKIDILTGIKNTIDLKRI